MNTPLHKSIADHTGSRPDRFYKTMLFRADALLLGLNCLEPGQVQAPHTHEDQDKFYCVISGEGHFWVDQERVVGRPGDVVWAPAGLSHGVENAGEERLTLLVGIAPAPSP